MLSLDAAIEGDNDSFFTAFEDGQLLLELIMLVDKDAVDRRVFKHCLTQD